MDYSIKYGRKKLKVNAIDDKQIVNIKWYSVKDYTPVFINTDDIYRCYNESDELLIISDGKIRIGYYRETCDYQIDKTWILVGRDMYRCDNVTHFAYMNFNKP